MLLQKIFFNLKDKYSISNDEIEDLIDVEQNPTDLIIYKNIINRFDSVLQLKFENMYIESKSIKNKLNTFLKVFLCKNAINSKIDHDLYLTSLDDFNGKYIISLLEKKSIYKFRISDIVNLWMLALTHVWGLFVKPLCVKNPYTNLEFSKSSLYNIFFKLVHTGFIIPPLIISFVKCNLDIDMFTIRNYPELKELSILNFMREGSCLDKYEYIINMLHDNRKIIDYHTIASLSGWSVKKRATVVFSNYLFLYLQSEFSCNPLIKNESRKRLQEKLKKFKADEPTFGFSPLDIVRYVPLDERVVGRIRENIQVPPSNYLRSQNAISATPQIPTTNEIVRNYSTDQNLPPIRINNFMTNMDNSETENTENTNVSPSVTISSTNMPSDIQFLLNTRNRTRDILQQIETIINDTDDTEEMGGSDEFGMSINIADAFIPHTELRRTPPEYNPDILPNISTVNAQEIIDRLNTVIDDELNSREQQYNDEHSNEFGNEIETKNNTD